MKTGVGLFLSSMAFGITISLVYWLTTGEITGTVLLGLMAFALFIIAGYIIVAEREADLASDKPDIAPSQASGERVGVYSLESYWPILAAASAALMAASVVFLPGIAGIIAVPAGFVLVWILWLFVRESR